MAYGVFDFAVMTVVRWRGGRAWPPLTDWQGRIDWPSLDWLSFVPVAEQLAGTWNCLVAVFPLSILAALLFVMNYRNLTRELIRTLHRRFGKLGWLLLLALVFCVLPELIKPVLLIALPELAVRIPWPALLLGATTINALAFCFEYLFGTALQLYLVLTIYGWARGLQFEERRVLPFAVRRLGFVIKWSLVIIATTLLLIHVPLLLDAWWTGGIRWQADALRLALALAMLACGVVQIQLALHNDSLREAFAANRRFLRQHGLAYAGLITGALALFFLFQMIRGIGDQMLGDSVVTAGWDIVLNVICAVIGGWVLAAWVCFYQERAEGKEIVY